MLVPWPGDATGWSVLLHTKRLRFRSPARAQTRFVGSIPGQGMYGKQLINVSLSLPPSPHIIINKQILGRGLKKNLLL